MSLGLLMASENANKQTNTHTYIQDSCFISIDFIHGKTTDHESRGAGTGGAKGGLRKVPSVTKSDLIVINIVISVNKSAALSVQKCALSL